MIGMLPPIKVKPIDWNYHQAFSQHLQNVVSQNAIKLTRYVDERFAFELNKYDIPYISKFEGFALEYPRDLYIEEGITYSDDRHLSEIGEEVFGKRLVEYMLAKNYKKLN